MQEEDKAVLFLLCLFPREAKGSKGRSVFLDREACPVFQELLYDTSLSPLIHTFYIIYQNCP